MLDALKTGGSISSVPGMWSHPSVNKTKQSLFVSFKKVRTVNRCEERITINTTSNSLFREEPLSKSCPINENEEDEKFLYIQYLVSIALYW